MPFVYNNYGKHLRQVPKPKYRKNFFNYFNYFLTGTEHGGPFNNVDPDPRTGRDGIFQRHDQAYGKIGDQAYTKYNPSDKTLLSEASWAHPGNIGAKTFFTAKRSFADSIDTDGEMPYKRARTMGGKPLLVKSAEFKATKQGGKKVQGVGKRHKHIGYDIQQYTIDTARADMPFVTWNMNGPLAPIEIESDAGKQQVTALSGGDAVATRTDLQHIYHKLYDDIAHTQTNAGPKPDYDADNIEDMPSLRCHGYTRQMKLFNTKDKTVYIEIYDCVAKKNIDSTGNSRDQFVNSLRLETAIAPGNYGLHEARLNNTVPMVERTLTINDPGIRPNRKNSSTWFEHWKPIRRTRIKMEANTHYNYSIQIQGFEIPQAELFDGINTTDNIPDLTVQPLVFTIGETCYDNAVGHQQMSYMDSKITIERRDFTKWSIKRKATHALHFETNEPRNFNGPTTNTPFHLATDPAVTTRHANAPVSDQLGMDTTI